MSSASVRDTKLAYDLTGEGPLFVWGHGLSSSRAAEDRLGFLDFDHVGRAVQVLRYDARNHGKSGDSQDPAKLSWAELAKDQLALLDVLELGPYIAAGASMGAGTALHAAVQAPERVKALVLALPPTGWETRKERIDIWEQMASMIESDGVDAFVSAMAAMPTPGPFVGRTDWKDLLAESARLSEPRRLAAAFRGAGHADLPDREAVRTIHAPTLILAWTDDPGHPVSTAEQLDLLMPNTELVIASSYDDFRTWTDRTLKFVTSVENG